MIASANVDEEVYEDADAFDLTKTNRSPHLAFGNGLHFCAGAALARAEARIAMELLLVHCAAIRRARPEPPHHEPNLTVRALHDLPVLLA
jgi:cytochrome P450